MQQISFSELAYTHKERFLTEMNDLLPWKHFQAHRAKVSQTG